MKTIKSYIQLGQFIGLLFIASCSIDNTVGEIENINDETEETADIEEVDDIEEITSENSADHESIDNQKWDSSSIIDITLNGNPITSDGDSV